MTMETITKAELRKVVEELEDERQHFYTLAINVRDDKKAYYREGKSEALREVAEFLEKRFNLEKSERKRKVMV